MFSLPPPPPPPWAPRRVLPPTARVLALRPFPHPRHPLQETHAQLGPGQSMVVRWASSHNNTFTWAIVAGSDEEWFRRDDYCECPRLVS